MELQLATLAELSRAAGFAPGAAADASARELELAFESSFMGHGLMRYQHVRETSAEEDPYVFALSGPEDAELAFLNERPVQELPKIALARWLELEKGWGRNEAFNTSTKLALILELKPDYAPAAPDPGADDGDVVPVVAVGGGGRGGYGAPQVCGAGGTVQRCLAQQRPAR